MRFVIIGSPRTGSSHLVNVLGAHPEILCNGNIYHPKEVFVFWPKTDLTHSMKTELLELRRTDPAALLERVFAANYGREHVGFKIFEGQNDQILQQLITDDKIGKIILYRKNILANYSSKLVARRTKKYDAKEGAVVEESETPKVRFHREDFISFYNSYNSFYRNVIESLNKTRRTFHFIDYDEINDPFLYSSLLTFIGATPSRDAVNFERRGRHLKQNSNDICSRFSNPDQVMKFLQEFGLLHWAHEGETSLDDLEASPSHGNNPGEERELRTHIPNLRTIPASPDHDP